MPNGSLEPIGVEAFAKGVDTFLNQMRAMQAAYEDVQKAAGGIVDTGKKTEGIFQKLGNVVGSVLSPLDSVTGGVRTFTTALVGGAGLAIGMGTVKLAASALSTAFSTVTGAIKGAAQSVVELALEGTRAEGIMTAFASGVARSGISLDAMKQAAAGTISDLELMRTANIALTGAGRELSKEFGQELPSLLEIARASAKATGQDVDFLFNSLVTGVKRSSPLLIDNTGLQLRLGEANEKMAAQVGIAVDELSAEQRQIALLRATVEAGQDIISLFGEEQRTTAENVARTGAQIQNLKDTLSQALQPALGTVSGAIGDFVSKLVDATQEGGDLYPVLVKLGSIASILADAFAAALDWIGNFITGLQNELYGGLAETTGGMYEWGVELVVSLTEGIVQAAETVLVSAMNSIGSVLSWWLGPGSPPNVAPELTEWGTEAITEWLHGMTEADFSVLEEIQQPLREVLSAEEFADISGDIIKALAEGVTDETLFEDIAEAAGEFGEEIARLAELQFELADATDAVAESEENLTASRQAVSDLTDEYNQLLREGADPSMLEAKLDEINAAEDALAVAEEQSKAAEEHLAALEEEAALQDQVTDTLLELAAAEEEAAAAAEEAAQASEDAAADISDLADIEAAAADIAIAAEDPWAAFVGQYEEDLAVLEKQRDLGLISEEDYFKQRQRLQEQYVEEAIRAGMPYDEQLAALEETKAALAALEAEAPTELEVELPTLEPAAISDSLTDAIEQAKGSVMVKFQEMFDDITGPLTDMWEESISPTLSNIVDKFEWLSDLAGDSLDKLKGKVESAWDSIMAVARSATDVLTQETWPQIQSALLALEAAMDSLGIEWSDVWNALGDATSIVLEALGVLLLGLVGTVVGVVNSIASAIEALTSHFEDFGAAFETIIEGASLIIVGFRQLFDGEIEGVGNILVGLGDIFEGVFDLIVETVETGFDVVIALVEGFVDGALSFFENLKEQLVGGSIIPDMIERFKSLTRDWVDWAKRTISDLIDSLIQKFTEMKDEILQIVEDFKNAMIEKIQAIIDIFYAMWDAITLVIEKITELVNLSEAFDALKEAVAGAAEQVLEFVSSLVEAVIPEWPFKLAETFKDIKNWVEDALDNLDDFIDTLADAAEKIPDFLLPGSPTPFERGLRGIAQAMRDISAFEMPRLNAALAFSPAGATMGAPAATTQRLVNITVAVGPVYISGPASLPVLESTIEQAVVRAVTRRGAR